MREKENKASGGISVVRAEWMNKGKDFVKKNAVLVVAIIGAAISSFIIPPDMSYVGYFDYKTLTCLFCTLAVVCALKNINFFYILARRIVSHFKTTRMCVLALVYITFIGSMLIANDMALLTFLPLGFYVLTSTGKQNLMAYVFILQNIAANLGGMLTPFGNPQNLYIYTKYAISNDEFVKIMFPPFILSIVIITICCLCISSEKLEISDEYVAFDKKKAVIYAVLFALSIVIVFRVVPYLVGLIVIPAVLIVADRKALKMVDYSLLFTFVSFFIFAGNLARIEVIRNFFSGLLHTSTLLTSVFSCQCISNVPTAILLSQFTDNYKELLLGVNIGGVGTLIASLASLITFREYVKNNPGKTSYYIKMFSVMNFGFLIILTVACYFVF